MSILSYIVAYYLYEWSVRKIEVSEAALYGYLQPVFALPAAYLLLGELPTRYFLLGGVLIGVGVLLTEYKKHQ
jgi:drug/metabolite transporter (DMT)-like permease